MVADPNTFVLSGKYLFVLYLVISSNYLGNLFGCKVQNLFSNNITVKHLLGFLTFYFFITVADSDNTYNTKQKFFVSIGVYLLFIISTKTHHSLWYGFIIPLGIVYLLTILEDEYKDDEEKKKQIKIGQKAMVSVSAFFLVVGFIYYIGEKKIEYGDDFDMTKLIFGPPGCANVVTDVKESFSEVMKKALFE